MKISATLTSSENSLNTSVNTEGNKKNVSIPASPSGFGSSLNGGELLFLSLATCYTNDIYREAAKRDISLTRVAVEVLGEFAGPGDPGFNITYHAEVDGDASSKDLEALMLHTDKVAEVHNTLRKGVEVTLAL